MTERRVILVEDDPASWDVMSQLLAHHQISVDVAESGEQAIQLLSQHRYNLAVIDFELPRMDGWDVLKAIKTNPDTQSLNAIAVTAYYTPRLAQDARHAGFLDCYAKPITQKLIQDIQGYLS